MTVGEKDAVKADPGLLRKKISASLAQILKGVPVKELLIEGGSTSFSIIQELGFAAFAPTAELQQGVVRMKVVGKDNLYITIKPGSYAWPHTWEHAFAD